MHEELLRRNLSSLVVPQWLYDELERQSLDTEGLIPVPVRRMKDEINPANLNYPWKGHPVR